MLCIVLLVGSAISIYELYNCENTYSSNCPVPYARKDGEQSNGCYYIDPTTHKKIPF